MSKNLKKKMEKMERQHRTASMRLEGLERAARRESFGVLEPIRVTRGTFESLIEMRARFDFLTDAIMAGAPAELLRKMIAADQQIPFSVPSATKNGRALKDAWCAVSCEAPANAGGRGNGTAEKS
mgnify:CR=1 FL=1